MTTSPIGDRAKMYVGGAWVGATNDREMAVSNPATGEVLAHVPDASREDVWRAIDQAADGRRRRHYAVELSRDDGHPEDRSRARGRLHGRLETRERHAAVGACACADLQ